jgi:hypothetical protein
MENNHSVKLFWFCVFSVAVGVAFLIALCFFPIPKGSERFADNVQGFMEGSIITAAISFLLGGNLPNGKKPTGANQVQSNESEENSQDGTPIKN